MQKHLHNQYLNGYAEDNAFVDQTCVKHIRRTYAVITSTCDSFSLFGTLHNEQIFLLLYLVYFCLLRYKALF